MPTSTRGAKVLELANEQIFELTTLLTARGDAALKLPCPGRGGLGDGTVGATAMHTAESYRRLAEFVGATVGGEDAHVAGDHTDHGGHLRGQDARVDELRDRLTAALETLGPLASLSDDQLDVVPPAGDMRFCDGQRTLEQIVVSVLKHQRHQIDALEAAVA